MFDSIIQKMPVMYKEISLFGVASCTPQVRADSHEAGTRLTHDNIINRYLYFCEMNFDNTAFCIK